MQTTSPGFLVLKTCKVGKLLGKPRMQAKLVKLQTWMLYRGNSYELTLLYKRMEGRREKT